MEQKFIFKISAMDLDALVPQVSAGLKKQQVALEPRKHCPTLWEVADRLRNTERVSEKVQEKRRKRRDILVVIAWVLGFTLFTVALILPDQWFWLLFLGAVSCAGGTVLLRRGAPPILFSAVAYLQAILTTRAIWMGVENVWAILLLLSTVVLLVLAAHLQRKRLAQFDQAAIQLLSKWQQRPDEMQRIVTFSEEGMTLSEEGKEDVTSVSFDRFKCAMETRNLFLLLFDESIIILQKKDLTVGTFPDFLSFLREKVEYIPVG